MSSFDVKVMLSNRHIHLNRADIDTLFGEGYELTPKNGLEAAQFAAEETLDVYGPKGCVEKIRILGPLRQTTQVELLRADCFKLGVKAPIRESGDLHDAAELKLVGPKGSITLPCGIIALRHIHLAPGIAKEHNISDRQFVSLKMPGERALTFDQVLVRLSRSDLCVVHLDTEEGNAANVKNGDIGLLIAD